MELKVYPLVLILVFLVLRLQSSSTQDTSQSCSTKCKCHQDEENVMTATCEDFEDLKGIPSNTQVLHLSMKGANGKNFSINTDTLSSFSNLRELQLKGFMISDISPLVFKNMKHLVHLDLSNNEISNIKNLSEILAYCPLLKYINLENNPLHCSCSFMQTTDFFFKRSVKIHGVVKCKNLPKLTKKSWSEIEYHICNIENNSISLQASTQVPSLENKYSGKENDEKISSWKNIRKRETEVQDFSNSTEYSDEFEYYTDDGNIQDEKQLTDESEEKIVLENQKNETDQYYGIVHKLHDKKGYSSHSSNISENGDTEIITTDYIKDASVRTESVQEATVKDGTTLNHKILHGRLTEPSRGTSLEILEKIIRDENEMEYKDGLIDVEKTFTDQIEEKYKNNGKESLPHDDSVIFEHDLVNVANNREYFEGYSSKTQGDSFQDKDLTEQEEKNFIHDEKPSDVKNVTDDFINDNENNESKIYKTAVHAIKYNDNINENHMKNNAYSTISGRDWNTEDIFSKQKSLGNKHVKHNRAMPLPIKGDPFTEEDYKEATIQFQSEGSGDSSEYDHFLSKFLISNNTDVTEDKNIPLLDLENEAADTEEDVNDITGTNYSEHVKLMLTTDTPDYETPSIIETKKDINLKGSSDSVTQREAFISLSTPEYKNAFSEEEADAQFEIQSTFLSTQNLTDGTTTHEDSKQNYSDLSTEKDLLGLQKVSVFHSNTNYTPQYDETTTEDMLTNEKNLLRSKWSDKETSAHDTPKLSLVFSTTHKSELNGNVEIQLPTDKTAGITQRPELKSSVQITQIPNLEVVSTANFVSTADFEGQLGSSKTDYGQKLKELNSEITKMNITDIHSNEEKITPAKSNVVAYVVVGVLVSGFGAIIAFVILKNRISRRSGYGVRKRRNNINQDQEMSELRDLEGQGLLAGRASTYKRSNSVQASTNQGKTEANIIQKNGYQSISVDHDSEVEQTKFDSVSFDLDDLKSVSTPSPIVSPLESSSLNSQVQSPTMPEAEKIRIVESELATKQKANIVTYTK